MTTLQQRTGAQRAAAARVREQEGAFRSDLTRVLHEVEGLRASYRGPAASAFFQLVGGWLEDATRIVADLDGFAARLDQQESEVAAQQDASATTFTRAASRLTTHA